MEKRNVVEAGRTPNMDKQADTDDLVKAAVAIMGRLPPVPGFENVRRCASEMRIDVAPEVLGELERRDVEADKG